MLPQKECRLPNGTHTVNGVRWRVTKGKEVHRMRIAMVAPERLPLPGSGSVEICIHALAVRLAERHEVTVLCRSAEGQPNRQQEGRLEFVRIPADSYAVYKAGVLGYLRQHKARFDLVQVDNRPGLMAAVKSACPELTVALFLHSLTFVPASRQVAGALARADLILANSRSLGRRLRRRFPRIPPVSVVPLGVDTERFRPAAAQFAGRPFTVLFAGRLIPRKGVPVLLRALHRIRRRVPAQLIVAGGGPPAYVRRLKQLARRLRIPAVFLGSVPHADIHRLYPQADCFVCPSQRHEAFGLVNVEAMACGLPVVASRIGGIAEIVEPGRSGFLVRQYKEPAAFAACLFRLAARPDAAEQMGRAARAEAEARFDWRYSAAALERLYAAALAGRTLDGASGEYRAPAPASAPAPPHAPLAAP